MIAAIDRHEFGDTFQRGESHGGAHFGHFAIRANVDDVVIAAEAEIAHEAHLRGQRIVVGHDGAALKGIEELRSVEAEDLATSEAADGFASVGAAKCVGRIKQELQVSPARNRFQCVDVARAAPDMYADDAAGAGRNHFLDLRRVEVMGFGVDIAEDRRNFLPLKGMRRGDKSERRHDYFSGQPERTYCNFQRNRGIAHGNAVTRPSELDDAFLEIPDVGTVIRQPIAVKHVVNALK